MGLRLILNRRGDSLIVVLAAMAISGIVIAGITTFLNNMQKSMKLLEARNEALELLVELKSVAANSPACRLNFAGQPLPPAGVPLSFNLFRFVDSSGTGLSNEDLVRQDQRLPLGTRVLAMSLVARSALPGSAYLADLRMTFGNSAASTSIVRNVRARVQLDGSGRIIDCTFDENGLGTGSAPALRQCETQPTLMNLGQPPTLPASSGTVVVESCPSYYSGAGTRHLCLDGSWIVTQHETCTSPAMASSSGSGWSGGGGP